MSKYLLMSRTIEVMMAARRMIPPKTPRAMMPPVHNRERRSGIN
jgi:hypothetical protein